MHHTRFGYSTIVNEAVVGFKAKSIKIERFQAAERNPDMCHTRYSDESVYKKNERKYRERFNHIQLNSTPRGTFSADKTIMFVKIDRGKSAKHFFSL